MSDYQPKVGDRVMVSEHGPYRVVFTESGAWADLRSIPENNVVADGVPLSWLTPTPEPEPDEPTAPGALVRDGQGRLLARDHDDEWLLLAGPSAIAGVWFEWSSLPHPIAVVLSDPAEVETLRAERDEALRRERVAQENAESRLQSAMKATECADELQRRINAALVALGQSSASTAIIARRILRGES